ncbi:sigma-70 family RNA polymerase sigma factor [Saccharothrix sp. NRRL B-16348]|uniref:sigma-70 family RNA polymerase sigma factor n=1 Tax=Saccharothrix sp. NRRL B-16348 TaxID=1415542 RepID=UPI0009ECB3CC|nr:sigma-70 family RNA polymerase sigma factor [Saccharothrix sp. NRRL B-16348]
MEEQVKQLREIQDPVRRAQQASDLVGRFQAAVTEISRLRKEALEEMSVLGMSQTEIAKHLDMTRSRVGQLLKTGPKIERAFFGTGSKLIVAVGGKLEAKNNNPGPVVAQEDFQAYDEFRSLASGLDFETDYEVVQPPGMINLNRDDLVVICGPRLSPLIAQVLESDVNIGFDRDSKGWHLLDRVQQKFYRSPMDDGTPADYAYVGKLPRLDGRGTFLYIAGIHAVGAAGVVHFLDGHIAELYREVKDGRFSTVVQCTFDAATRRVLSSKRVAPIYK